MPVNIPIILPNKACPAIKSVLPNGTPRAIQHWGYIEEKTIQAAGVSIKFEDGKIIYDYNGYHQEFPLHTNSAKLINSMHGIATSNSNGWGIAQLHFRFNSNSSGYTGLGTLVVTSFSPDIATSRPELLNRIVPATGLSPLTSKSFILDGVRYWHSRSTGTQFPRFVLSVSEWGIIRMGIQTNASSIQGLTTLPLVFANHDYSVPMPPP